MIKVEIIEVYGSGAQGHRYWSYDSVVMVKGSVKRAISFARKSLWERAKDKEGFNWIPVIYSLKVWNNNKLIIEEN